MKADAIIKLISTVAAVVAILGFLIAIYTQVETNCDATASTNSGIVKVLAVSAAKEGDGDSEYLNKFAKEFARIEC